MSYFHAIILAIIEGLTEFLPISSTGHLILAANLLHIPQTDFVKSYEIFIQLGAIMAVVVMYWQLFLKNSLVWKKVLYAFIPTGIIGFILYKLIKTYLLGNVYITLAALFLGGIVLILIEYLHKQRGHVAKSIDEIPGKNAIIIGIVQSLAVIPGVSRSAATVISAVLLGTSRRTAVEFSFLLAVPTMLAASGLDLLKSNLSFSPYEVSILSIGFCVSFFVAFLAIKFFLRYVEKHTFTLFGVYRIVLAIIYWMLLLK